MNFIANEQKAVVESRIKDGYSYITLSNGFYELIKGKHKMIINGMGYDTFVPLYMSRM